LAEEVEITNFGKGGVASEETLAELLKTMDRLARSKGFDPKEVNKKTKELSKSLKDGIEIVEENRKALDNNTDSLKDNTSMLNKGLGLLGNSLGYVANRMTAFGSELLFGGNTLSTFAKELPLVGTVLTPLTQMIDDNVETYREFSTIGGTAAKGLYDFSIMAAQAGVPIDDFRQLIMENSQSLKLFGATTTSGAKNLAALSKEFRDGPGRELMQLGFTSTELNETLIDLAELNSNIFTMGRIRDKVTAKSAAEFSNTLFDLSVITGKRRDQLKDEMKQAASDYRSRVAMASMDDDQQKRFLANLTMGGAAMQDALLDMADGIPNSDLAARLSSLSNTFRAKSRDIEDMDPREMNNFMFTVREEMEAFAAANGTTIQALAESDAGIRGILDFTEQTKDLRFLTEEQYNKEKADKAAMKAREDSVLAFNETLNNIRTNLKLAFIDSGILQTVQDVTDNLVKALGDEKTMSVINNGLTSMSTSISNFLEAFAEDPKKAISNALKGIGNSILDVLMGEKIEDPRDPNYGQREGGALDDILKGLAPLGGMLIDSIVSGIKSAMDNDTWIDEIVLGIGALFLLGNPIALALTAGIKSLFLLKGVTSAMVKGAKSLWPKKPANYRPDQLLDRNGKPLSGTALEARKRKLDREAASTTPEKDKPKKPDVDPTADKKFKMPKWLKGGAGILGALLVGAELLSISNDDELSARDKKVESTGAVAGGVGGAAGGYGGALAGAAAGAAIGSIVPFLGTAVGGAIGGILGGLGGGALGYVAGDAVGTASADAVLSEEGDTVGTSGADALPPKKVPTVSPAMTKDQIETIERLSNASAGIERIAGAFERIGAVQGLQENMASFQADLKIVDMRNFNTQLMKMGDNLEKINDELSKDNNGMLRRGTGVNAGSLFENSGVGSQGIDSDILKELNSNIALLVQHEANEEKYLRKISQNTGGVPSDVTKVPTNVRNRGRNGGRSGR